MKTSPAGPTKIFDTLENAAVWLVPRANALPEPASKLTEAEVIRGDRSSVGIARASARHGRTTKTIPMTSHEYARELGKLKRLEDARWTFWGRELAHLPAAAWDDVRESVRAEPVDRVLPEPRRVG